ncbi:hypothetical protein EDB80DRAFT_579151 [Ilyonectria destructans]|nr:hypothetical protein EDB80DRAFT_579151 [Ilyonectria destructans]
MAISSPPPDPHPRIISTLDPLPDDTISEIFATFTEAVGFYLLVNGYLQIIVPEDFDYESSISSLPDQFGGLKVSFIPQSLYPTAGDPGATGTASSITQSASGMAGASSTTATEEPSNQPPATINLPIRPLTSTPPEGLANQGITANFKGSLGSTVRAVVKGSKSKNLFEGKIGVLVTPVGGDNRKFATVPTHVFTSACNVPKMSSTEITDWIDLVSVQSTSTSTDLGNLVQVFDPCPQSFPIGFTSDVSLIDVSQIPATRVRSPAGAGLPIMQWLDQNSWKTIQYNSSNLFLLDGEPREAKSIGIVDSRCQVRNRLRQPSTDPKDDLKTWVRLVAKSILYRVRQDLHVRGGQSGTPVCVLDNGEENSVSPTAKVAGFASFVQMVSDVQRYDLEGDKLYKRLEEGRVAFYGAFQVPRELRDEYRII